MSQNPNPNWRRQAAVFAAAVSAFTGLGVVIIVLVAARDPKPPRKEPAPPSTRASAPR